ncbi:serine/threonine protein kinase [Nannocystis punicea]|uniref:Serine/threonine-protein kinase n=1 Tax=Nannocystis punicea TaxID=2995304 RepID=A0ABY7HFJ6_9BACT|nr:serine/threonine-protein kinase [Nannocystis poenicansa]WAS98048.1 serine/threonine-protein kinase [Nannocystis poenicansa]
MTTPTNLLRAALEQLLRSLFDTKTLRHYLHLGPDGDSLVESLPESCSLSELVHVAVDLLLKRGLVEAALFDRLCHEFPQRAKDIRTVQAASIDARPLGREVPLVPLRSGPTLDQLEQAYLRREECIVRGEDTGALDREILELRRIEYRGPQLRAGQSLLAGRYRLLDTLGSGGFATVWRAHDRETRQVVALKVLHGQWAADRSYCDRFTRGARVMIRLNHPNIVRVFREPCEDEGHRFYAMELIDGTCLHRAVLTEKLALDAGIRALLEICDALSFAHERGYVHRDVKPTNILLHRNGRAYLSDFDLIRGPDTTGGTRTGAGLGSMLYAAPESLYGASRVDARADVYSVGMTLLFLALGRELNLEDFLAAQNEHLTIPPAIAPVIYKATTRRLERRYSSIAELKAALQTALAAWPWDPSRGTSSPASEERVVVLAVRSLVLELADSPFFHYVAYPGVIAERNAIAYNSLFQVARSFLEALFQTELKSMSEAAPIAARLADTISRTFNIVKNAWPVAWAQSPRKTRLTSGVGLRALSWVLVQEIAACQNRPESEELWSIMEAKVGRLRSRIVWAHDELASASHHAKATFSRIMTLQSTPRDLSTLKTILRYELMSAESESRRAETT